LYFSDAVVSLDLKVFNAARIWKVYGTMACKGDDLPERPHRLARLLEVPDPIGIVTSAQLEALAALVPDSPAPAPRRGYPQTAPFDLGQWILSHGLPVVSEGSWHQTGYRWVLNPCPWNSAHTNNAAFTVQLASGAIAAGCHHNGCQGNNWQALRDLYEPGWCAYRHNPPQLTVSGQTPPTAVSPPGQGSAPTTSFVLTSLSDLLNEPEEAVEWLVDGLLPESGFSLLVAKPKVGKTTLARNLALCVAQGRDFLGRETQQGPVIYLALEEKRSEVQKHFRNMGATGAEDIHLYVASAPADGLQQVRAAAEQLKPALIIIDPLFRFTCVKDSNDYAQVTQALEPLLVLASETRAHVLCAHHAGKGNREGGDSILGSTAIFGAVDTALIMKKLEGYRTLQSEQRYGDNLEETALRLDPTTRTVTLGATKEAEDEARLCQAICEYLPGQADPVTEAVIDEAVEERRGIRKKALRKLVAEGKVTRHGKGGKADPFTYALAAPPSQQEAGFCDSPVSRIYQGTTKPEPPNGVISSNGMVFCGSQDLPKIENAREPENGRGNHNREPIVVGDCVYILNHKGEQLNETPYLCTAIEPGLDGRDYALFLEIPNGFPVEWCERADPLTPGGPPGEAGEEGEI
jgi:hypothetical protein